ncbi:hypothetical protein H696_03119 [Fonticula alba]|uniref:Uncharacterized protein n=1 Tax=Fonticula alba TaxID=691883 RepID=A0A058Z8X7_FONAL|nr:hypothetical protein H696_03119 [Fonticula alba]KCV70769.1 hypothetical protein H696_03119 [Fonticula alba]|eukprot:XP_009495285.1 hypothetical protein H696_03119 [Fonticula alba]
MSKPWESSLFALADLESDDEFERSLRFRGSDGLEAVALAPAPSTTPAPLFLTPAPLFEPVLPFSLVTPPASVPSSAEPLPAGPPSPPGPAPFLGVHVPSQPRRSPPALAPQSPPPPADAPEADPPARPRRVPKRPTGSLPAKRERGPETPLPAGSESLVTPTPVRRSLRISRKKGPPGKAPATSATAKAQLSLFSPGEASTLTQIEDAISSTKASLTASLVINEFHIHLQTLRPVCPTHSPDDPQEPDETFERLLDTISRAWLPALMAGDLRLALSFAHLLWTDILLAPVPDAILLRRRALALFRDILLAVTRAAIASASASRIQDADNPLSVVFGWAAPKRLLADRLQQPLPALAHVLLSTNRPNGSTLPSTPVPGRGVDSKRPIFPVALEIARPGRLPRVRTHGGSSDTPSTPRRPGRRGCLLAPPTPTTPGRRKSQSAPPVLAPTPEDLHAEGAVLIVLAFAEWVSLRMHIVVTVPGAPAFRRGTQHLEALLADWAAATSALIVCLLDQRRARPHYTPLREALSILDTMLSRIPGELLHRAGHCANALRDSVLFSVIALFPQHRDRRTTPDVRASLRQFYGRLCIGLLEILTGAHVAPITTSATPVAHLPNCFATRGLLLLLVSLAPDPDECFKSLIIFNQLYAQDELLSGRPAPNRPEYRLSSPELLGLTAFSRMPAVVSIQTLISIACKCIIQPFIESSVPPATAPAPAPVKGPSFASPYLESFSSLFTSSDAQGPLLGPPPRDPPGPPSNLHPKHFSEADWYNLFCLLYFFPMSAMIPTPPSLMASDHLDTRRSVRHRQTPPRLSLEPSKSPIETPSQSWSRLANRLRAALNAAPFNLQVTSTSRAQVLALITGALDIAGSMALALR